MSDYRGRSGRSVGRGGGYRPGAPGPYRGVQSNNKPVWFLIIADVLVLGVALNVFALSRNLNTELDSGGITLPPRSTMAAPSPSLSPAATQAGSESGNTATQSPAAEQTATPQPVDMGMWGEKFADKFTTGEVEKTDNSYKSKDINVKIDKVQENGVTYFLADIYVRNLDNFKAGLANGKPLQMNQGEMTDKQAQRYNAIVAINGDNYGDHQTGVVVRNGEFGRDKSFGDVCIMYNDGTMKTLSAKSFNFDQEKDKGLWQIWGFGPMLLDENGAAMTKFDSRVTPANPRTALGYYEPGHYCFLVVDGRQGSYSKGLSLSDMSSLFASLGCKAAYNLDGGRTTIMAFMGNVYNKPYEGGRSTSDIVYIGEIG